VLGALGAVGAGGAWSAAILILLAGSLTVVRLYWLAHEFLDERGARACVLIWLFAPNVLLESATSFDALFASVSTAAAVYIVRRRVIVAGLLFAAASSLTYGVITIAAWSLVVMRRRSPSWRQVLRDAIAIACMTAACYGLVALISGYDPFAAYRATRYVYEHGISADRPLWFWFFRDQAPSSSASAFPASTYLAALFRMAT